MKAYYTSFAGVRATKDLSNVAEALRKLPVRAAGYAMIGIVCPGDRLNLDVVKVNKIGNYIEVEFGNDLQMDTIGAYLYQEPDPSPEF